MSRQAKIIVGAVILVLLLSTVGAVIVLGKADSPSTTAATVRIEVRSMPAMTIKKDGKMLGHTPVSFQVRKSSKPISLDADWTEQRVYRTGAKMVPRQAHKDVVPDHTMTVDFTRADGLPVQMDKVEDPTE